MGTQKAMMALPGPGPSSGTSELVRCPQCPQNTQRFSLATLLPSRLVPRTLLQLDIFPRNARSRLGFLSHYDTWFIMLLCSFKCFRFLCMSNFKGDLFFNSNVLQFFSIFCRSVCCLNYYKNFFFKWDDIDFIFITLSYNYKIFISNLSYTEYQTVKQNINKFVIILN